MSGLTRVSYKNVSGIAVPPHGIVQLTGAPITTSTGKIVLQATLPGSGDGPYMIDDGKGAAASGDGQYGTCVRGIDGVIWVAYGCGGGPASPWCNVGPIIGSFFVNESGQGYTWDGLYDAPNSRIQVLMNTFNQIAAYCSSLTSSSSSSGGSGSSGSSSSSSGSNCLTVVTDVQCTGGNLVVTYGNARKC